MWGLRTDRGLWYEAYRNSIPIDSPFLLDKPSKIGLFAAAALDPEWFTGLPFTEEDTHHFREMSHRYITTTSMQKPSPNWTPGNIVANWHSQDDIVTDKLLTADGLQELL